MINEENTLRIHAANAGLIICHPFLTQLFTSLDYLNEQNQFNDEESRFRAISLLHYMGTGQLNEFDEVDLAIPKILCGISLNHQIPIDIVITGKETSMGLELLEAVISKWEKLGTTSIDGLRQTFLQRIGLLENDDVRYNLTMESSGVDILLDFIPWNISMIQLPWNSQAIQVYWR